MNSYLNIVRINKKSMVPVYIQVANAIVKGVEEGQIVKYDLLPSLHNFCVVLDISRQSVEKAYNTLKARGVVAGVRGKGHFIIGV